MPEGTGQANTYSPRPSAGDAFSATRDVKALNSAVLVITQKIKYLVRNEKILGRNLIVLNKRIRDLQTTAALGAGQEVSEETQALIQEMGKQVETLRHHVVELQGKVDELQSGKASGEDVKEIKYVIDAMNPLHFVTVEQVKQMLQEWEKKKT